MKSLIFMGYPPPPPPPDAAPLASPPPPPAYTAGGKLIDSKLSVKESYSFSYSC